MFVRTLTKLIFQQMNKGRQRLLAFSRLFIPYNIETLKSISRYLKEEYDLLVAFIGEGDVSSVLRSIHLTTTVSIPKSVKMEIEYLKLSRMAWTKTSRKTYGER